MRVHQTADNLLTVDHEKIRLIAVEGAPVQRGERGFREMTNRDDRVFERPLELEGHVGELALIEGVQPFVIAERPPGIRRRQDEDHDQRSARRDGRGVRCGHAGLPTDPSDNQNSDRPAPGRAQALRARQRNR